MWSNITENERHSGKFLSNRIEISDENWFLRTPFFNQTHSPPTII